jgi:hypothetical protein
LLSQKDVYDDIPNVGQLVAGAEVQITGEIGEYEGELEIVPEADGVKVIK